MIKKFDKKEIQLIIDKSLDEAPCGVNVRYDESMKEHTTFKAGGPADCWIQPFSTIRSSLDSSKPEDFSSFCAALLFNAKQAGVPVFILGGGANIVVSDLGISGIVLDTGAFKGFSVSEQGLTFCGGTAIDEAAKNAASLSLSGLEFLAGMPGSIGGAVYMNARCYGSEISDVLAYTEILDYSVSGKPVKKIIHTDKKEFDYKKSPFQEKENLILSACFNVIPSVKNEIEKKMEEYQSDRIKKGHYLYPCAGSAFKNNRDFGKPTGQIIDELGLKGFQIGGAQIAPFHGNIVINTGNATSSDICLLIGEVSSKVKESFGFILEPEILFIGIDTNSNKY